jgi:hypothetical protein
MRKRKLIRKFNKIMMKRKKKFQKIKNNRVSKKNNNKITRKFKRFNKTKNLSNKIKI